MGGFQLLQILPPQLRPEFPPLPKLPPSSSSKDSLGRAGRRQVRGLWSPRGGPTLSVKSLPGGGCQTPPTILFLSKKGSSCISWDQPNLGSSQSRSRGRSRRPKEQHHPEPQGPWAMCLQPGSQLCGISSSPIADRRAPIRSAPEAHLDAQDTGRLRGLRTGTRPPGSPAGTGPRA